MTRARQEPVIRPEEPCRNCGDPTPGQYCPTCGQRKTEVRVSVRAMVMDVLEDQFVLDKRLPRTLAGLFLHPGFLTREHIDGRIVRYVRPLKMYLAGSVIFFLVLSFFSLHALEHAEFGEADRVTGANADSAAVARFDVLLADSTLAPQVRANVRAARDSLASRLARNSGVSGLAHADASGPAQQDTSDSWLKLGPAHTGIARLDSVLVRRTRELGAMEPRQAAERVARGFFGYIPTVMFILLPIFALVLKLLYVRTGRFYAEHFIFLLHVHTFVFLIFTAMLLLGQVGLLAGWIVLGLLLWVAAYVFLAMRRVYGQGRMVTFLKWWTLGWAYFWVFAITVPLAFAATILLV